MYVCNIKQETMSDPILNKLIEYYNNVWPNKEKVDSNLLLFYNIKSEIIVEDSIVYYNDKIIIIAPINIKVALQR